ncbi:MAG: bifunctional 5,10-methylenetetrahydrofolate dehydrogenase/5,10-methenyltetrahydrofolate cyclohydrolase [candidate division SR1 bacterium]|nr:bifunctional 5,10-methylenetetrahydrofolate dehydrogenase/5,10-methenyltetrahydrofolate cyclohydrolase [candidate division SR1 bacterium]
MILSGKELSVAFKQELIIKRAKFFGESKAYVAIIFLGEDYSSATYVKHKKAYGDSIGLPVIVFGQNHHAEYDRNQAGKFDDVDIYVNQNYDSVGKVMELIRYLNHDDECVGIIIQLPLPQQFEEYKEQLLAAITPQKDLDGLGGVVVGLSEMGLIDFVPATPKAVLYLLQHYKLDNFTGKTVAILGQSNIVGKPLALECIKREATVYTCNVKTPPEQIKTIAKMADYIISSTGKVHLIDDSFVRDDNSQIIVDVGYGHIDGKPVGDVNIATIQDKVASYTPVPGGIGPLTVACLFDNVFVLQSYGDILKPYKL